MFSSVFEKRWEDVVEYGIATDEEIGLVVGIVGTYPRVAGETDILDSIVYCRTGFPTLDSYIDDMNEEEK
jgi:hypothetical protein